MPELPEVEQQARALCRWLGGARIVRAEADPTRVFRKKNARAAFVRALAGRTLARVERKGKYLLLYFDAGVGLLSHLGMTGKWVRRAGEEAPPRHSRARLYLPEGVVLHYDDPRMFGRLAIAPASELARLPEVSALGPDPLHDGVDEGALAAALARTRRPVKVALMDGTVIAGIGNIQATEALWRARVHPARPAHSLSRAEIAALAEGIRASIAHTLAIQGDVEEIPYLASAADVPNPFLIYDRAGDPCPTCGADLVAIPLAGRTSAFCPSCQRPRRVTRSAPRRGRG